MPKDRDKNDQLRYLRDELVRLDAETASARVRESQAQADIQKFEGRKVEVRQQISRLESQTPVETETAA